MSLAFQSLLSTVLMVCGAVAFLPMLWLKPQPHVSPPLRAGLQRPGIWLVENPKGQWFWNGAPQSKRDLAALLRRQGRKPLIHYLPSDALPLENVASSLTWLRSLVPGTVVLDFPPDLNTSQ